MKLSTAHNTVRFSKSSCNSKVQLHDESLFLGARRSKQKRQSSTKSTTEKLWRVPGHHGDGQYSSCGPSFARQDEVQVARKKCLGDDFVVGKCQTSYQTPSLQERASKMPIVPAHNPYDWAWLGSAPSGRWILDGGRPRCVHDNTTVPFAGGKSVKLADSRPWGCTYESSDLEAGSSYELGSTISGHADNLKNRTHNSHGEAKLAASNSSVDHHSESSQEGSSDSDSTSSSYNSSSNTRFTRGDSFKNGSPVASAQPVKVESLAKSCLKRRESKFELVRSPKRAQSKNFNFQRTPQRKSTRTKSWRARAPGEIEKVEDILSSLEHGHANPAMQRLPRFSWFQPQNYPKPAFDKRTMKTPPVDRRKKSINDAAVVKHDGRKADRDLRSELRRLKENLALSAQSAFDQEVWEDCGVESDHLKRIYLMPFIQGGLGNLFQREEEDETIDAVSAPVGTGEAQDDGKC